MKFDICVRNIKNLQSNNSIFKIFSHVKLCPIINFQTITIENIVNSKNKLIKIFFKTYI